MGRPMFVPLNSVDRGVPSLSNSLLSEESPWICTRSLDRAPASAELPQPEHENDRALAVMLGVAALAGAGMWGAFLMVLL